MFNKLLAFLALSSALAISGCATSPVATDSLDQAAKTFIPKPGKANVYVYRNEMFGGAVSMEVFLNGQSVGRTGAQTYLLLEVPPGKHTITSKAENESRVELTVEAGKNYFVWQEVKMGIMSARNQLQVVNETAGRAGVAESKLLAVPR